MNIKKADIIYLDCFSGISGDMFIGAMLDLGYPKEELFSALSLLGVPNDILEIYEERRLHIKGCGILVKEKASLSHHTTYAEISSLIKNSQLNENVRSITMSIFHRIAEAEAKVHGQRVDDIVFHETGALDSIVDIVGAASIMDFFKRSTFISAQPKLGDGFVTCKHGAYPVPAPATLEILKGIPIHQDINGTHELITPTGAAILATLCHTFSPIPQGRIITIGYGIGQYDDPHIPNVLRVFAMKEEKVMPVDRVQILETHMDDMNPEWFGYMMDQLYAAKALDVFYTSICMKKNRPGILVTVLCDKENLQKCSAIIFKHSTTLGIRIRESRRILLRRKIKEINTPYGVSKVKIGYLDNGESYIAPEYEACARLCDKAGISIKTAYEITIKCYREHKNSSNSRPCSS
ncbi:MAG: nickel pincer cofactor biosynthesis protein LarC [bacterium]